MFCVEKAANLASPNKILTVVSTAVSTTVNAASKVSATEGVKKTEIVPPTKQGANAAKQDRSMIKMNSETTKIETRPVLSAAAKAAA